MRIKKTLYVFSLIGLIFGLSSCSLFMKHITPENNSANNITPENDSANITEDLNDFEYSGAEGNYAITGVKNKSAVTLTIPNSVTSIGGFAFSGCSSLTNIIIPNSVTSIGYGAFDECSSLTSITIPNSVVRIGSHAFEYCKDLTTIKIPDSVKEIGDYAFSNCEQLHKLILPRDIKNIKIANTAFWCNHYQAEIVYLGTIDEWIKNNENWEYNFNINCIDGILKIKEVKPVDFNADDDDLPF